MPKNYYSQSIQEIVSEEKATIETGLSNDDVNKRLAKYGTNTLVSNKKRSLLMRFIDQFKDLMIIVLIVAAVLYGVVAQEWTDTAIIMIVVLLNAILGVIQEERSKAAIDALKEMAAPQAHV